MNEAVKRRVFILHGNGGATSTGAWIPWVKAQLEALGFVVITPDMPDNIRGRAKYWMPFIKKLGITKDDIVIGWSSGGVAFMRYVEINPVFALILVAAHCSDLGDAIEKASGFFTKPWKWLDIKKHAGKIIQFYSDTDPWITVDEQKIIERNLDSEAHLLPNRGHLGVKPYATEFLELVERIDSLRAA